MPHIWRERLTSLLCLCISAALASSFAAAQTNTENFAQFHFNFNNPGARATGMGGAYVSIADDATASEANPAGLTALLRPEFSFEGKGIQFTQHVNNFSSTGPFNNFTVLSKDFKSSLFSPSFASLVFPLRRFVFSVYRYELVNFESAFYTEGSFISGKTDGSSFFPVSSDTKLRVVNWGGSAAFKFNEMFSIGLSGGLSNIDVNSTLARYRLEYFLPQTLANIAQINDNNGKAFINVGVIFKPAENFSFGATYKRRPEFTLHHSFTFSNFPTDSTNIKQIHFNVPSSWSVGASYRPTDVLTIAFDAVGINYSALTKDFVPTIDEAAVTASDYKVDNGVELHGGAEYVLVLRSVSFVLRAGFYTEPDNRIRWVGAIGNDPNTMSDRQDEAALFQSGDSYFHTTFGLGIVLSNNLQFDVAGNLSKISNEAAGSVVVRF